MRKRPTWAFTTLRIVVVMWSPDIEGAGKRFSCRSEHMCVWAADHSGRHTQAAEEVFVDLFRHDAMSWTDLVHELDARTRDPASGCPVVVVVQPTHDRTSDHLVACILSARNRSALFRDLLLDPLMPPLCWLPSTSVPKRDSFHLEFRWCHPSFPAFFPGSCSLQEGNGCLDHCGFSVCSPSAIRFGSSSF
jgi:hypothetical protein